VTRRSTLARLLFALFATVQLALPPVAAWADAAIEREASARAESRPHIEAHTENGCARVHPADCALCHAACATFTRPASAALVVAVRRTSAPGSGIVRRRAPSGGGFRDSQPRAPPALG